MAYLASPKLRFHEAEALSPFTSPKHSSHNSFPIIAVAIIGILATALLLVSYYLFLIKCCLNWHRVDVLTRFSLSRSRRVQDPSAARSPAAENRGLDEALIRAIPIFGYKRYSEDGERCVAECAVCLSEFQEDEKLRCIPNCGHMFHIDCIDVWLQNNANCPLCRNSISIASTTRFPRDHHIPNSFPPIQNRHSESFTDRDEDYVVIEIGAQNGTNQTGELSVQQPKMLQKKAEKLSHVSSMGDECIDIRHKDEQFDVQPIRRSFSTGSAADGKLYFAVQEIVQQRQHTQLISDVSSSEGCSSNYRIKRSFFSFGHGRGSRSAILLVHMDI